MLVRDRALLFYVFVVLYASGVCAIGKKSGGQPGTEVVGGFYRYLAMGNGWSVGWLWGGCVWMCSWFVCC